MAIRILSEGLGATTKVIDEETGEDICKKLAVTGIAIKIAADDVVKAEIDMGLWGGGGLNVVSTDVTWRTKHPKTGKFEPVRSIAFADGTTVVLGEDGSATVVE